MVLTTLTPSSFPAVNPQRARASIAIALVILALTFNQVLAFVNTTASPIVPGFVMGAEVLILTVAAILVSNREENLYPLSAAIIGWLLLVMTIRFEIDPKVLRDAFIPVLFYFLGKQCGSPETCDRLVMIAVALVAADALLEWTFLDSYLRFVDVRDYYIAKGSTDELLANDGPALFTSGLRLEGRMFPSLGEHRVSSVFLEPVSLGNFGAIAFAWLLLRFRTFGYKFFVWTALVLLILVLGDARFGLLLCGVIVIAYLVAPLTRPGVVFVAPFVMILLLLAYADANAGAIPENTLLGRFFLSGQLLSTLDGWQALGLESSDVNFVDSGYATVLSQFSLFGAAGLWATYVYGSPANSLPAWRFKLFVCTYYILLLSISTSFATIKTAAFLWFLAGGTSTLGALGNRRSNSGAVLADPTRTWSTPGA